MCVDGSICYLVDIAKFVEGIRNTVIGERPVTLGSPERQQRVSHIQQFTYQDYLQNNQPLPVLDPQEIIENSPEAIGIVNFDPDNINPCSYSAADTISQDFNNCSYYNTAYSGNCESSSAVSHVNDRVCPASQVERNIIVTNNPRFEQLSTGTAVQQQALQYHSHPQNNIVSAASTRHITPKLGYRNESNDHQAVTIPNEYISVVDLPGITYLPESSTDSSSWNVSLHVMYVSHAVCRRSFESPKLT